MLKNTANITDSITFFFISNGIWGIFIVLFKLDFFPTIRQYKKTIKQVDNVPKVK